MLKGERRLLKELDMCRIIKDIKDLQIERDKNKPTNLLAGLLGTNNAACKHHMIDVDNSSEDDLPLLAKLKRSMSMNVRNQQLTIEKQNSGATSLPMNDLLKP